MSGITKQLRHTHTIGHDTPERIVAASACPPLRATRIALAGLTDAGRGYVMVRQEPDFEQLSVCVGGEGQVLVDDQWRSCRAGQAYLMPPLATHAFRTAGRKRWRFCWIIYDAPKRGDLPTIGGDRPRIVDADPRGLWTSIEGLHHEATGSADPAMLERWSGLVQSNAARVVDPYHDRDPLWRLWATVIADLASNWTLERMAEHALMSAEHIRRLSLRHTGRSPMSHVTHLRMTRAAALLESTPMKIAAVAVAVGYTNPFAFSTAFRRAAGMSPAEWRARVARPAEA